MLPNPQLLPNIPFRFLGIDPGSVTLGVGVLDLDLTTGSVTLVNAQTFDASRLIRQPPYRNMAEIYGDRYTRLMAHEDNLVGFMHHTQPHLIASESPYMGRFPQAYAALVECCNAITRAAQRYDGLRPVHFVDPMSIKKAMGITTKGAKRGTADISKNAMHTGLLSRISEGRILNPFDVDVDALDEHSVDAIAVAYSQVSLFLTSMNFPTS